MSTAGDAFPDAGDGDPSTEEVPVDDDGIRTRGRLAWLRWTMAFLGAGATSLLGLVAMMMIGMGCTDCSEAQRNVSGLLMLVALAGGPALGLVGLWAADRGWRAWLIWAGVVAASLIGVNNLLWSTSYGR